MANLKLAKTMLYPGFGVGIITLRADVTHLLILFR